MYWQRSSNLDDRWIVELSSYAIIFKFHDKIESMGEDKDPEDSSFSYTGTFPFSRCEEYNLLLPLLKNGCFLIDPYVFWRFYKVLLESIPLFWIWINCKSVQSQEIFHLETWNLFSHQFWFEKLRFQPPKEVNKLDLRRIYLHMVSD